MNGNKKKRILGMIQSRMVIESQKENGTIVFNMMKVYGIIYRYAGENIASGYSCPEAVLRGWMNSEGHRKNILSPKYTHIGVGYYYTSSGNYHHYWTQEFIGLLKRES